MMSNLAIVIPAYKAIFFRAALASIANQTDNRFTLYIGDDSSPEELYSIVKPFHEKMNIVYKKFDQNLGAKDLVAHWERCIEMIREEEWIWLFSDDDVMDENCVEVFYKNLQRYPSNELLHFNVNIIDNRGETIKKAPLFPKHLTVQDFFLKRIKYQINSFVVEYIFTKRVYLEQNKFQNFDLAWCADDATWIKFGYEKGIYTMSDAFVYWRFSSENVSSSVKDKSMVLRKLNAATSYIKWVETRFVKEEFNKTSDLLKTRWVLGSVNNVASFPLFERIRLYNHVIQQLGEKFQKNIFIKMWFVYSLTKNTFFNRREK